MYMHTLKETKVSTLFGTLLLIVTMLPITVYTFMFKTEDAKLHNGPETSPSFIVNIK